MEKRVLILILFLIFFSSNVYAAVCTPVDSDIMLTIDNTKSIQEPIDHSNQVTNTIKDFINKASAPGITSNNRIGIVSFGIGKNWMYGDISQIYSKLLSHLSYVPAQKTSLINSLSNLDFMGESTEFFMPLNKTLYEFNSYYPRNVDKYIILFTDGLPTYYGCRLGDKYLSPGDTICDYENQCVDGEWEYEEISEWGCVKWREDCSGDDCCDEEGWVTTYVTYCTGHIETVETNCRDTDPYWEWVVSTEEVCIQNISDTIKNLGIKIYVIDTSGTHSNLLKNLASDSSKYFDLSNYNDLSTTFTNIFQEVTCKPPIIIVSSPQSTSYTPYNTDIINFIAQSTAQTGVWKININGQNTTILSNYYTTYGVNYPKSFNDGTYTIKFYAQESESTQKIWSETSPITFTMKKTFCGDGIIQSANGEACDNTNLNYQSCTSPSFGFTNGNLACYPSTHPSKCTFDYSGCFNMYWADANSKSITSKVSNTTVKIIKTNMPLSPSNVQVNIYKKGSGSSTATITGTVNSSGVLVGNWEIPLITSGKYFFSVNGINSSDLDISQAPFCGDGIVQTGEVCDGANLNGKSCSTAGYPYGTPTCNSSCGLNTSNCFNMYWADTTNNQEITSTTTGTLVNLIRTNAKIGILHNFSISQIINGNPSIIGGEIDGNVDSNNNLIAKWTTTTIGNFIFVHNVTNSPELNVTAAPITAIPSWANLNGDNISNAELGDIVMMVYKNSGLNGTTKNFEVYSKNCGILFCSDVDIRTDANAIQGTADSNGVIRAYWTINQDDLNKADGNLADFIFRVTGFQDSGKLEISENGNDDNFTIDFISPKCGDYFNISQSFQIKINATDNDDIINGTLTIEDIQKNVINSFLFENGISNFDVALASSGTFKLTAEGTNTKGRVRRIINIMIINISVNDRYVAAYINEPLDYTNLQSGWVKFNASSTTGIDYKTTGTFTRIPLKDIDLYWTFSDQRTSSYVNGSDTISYNFYKIFLIVNNNWAELNPKLKPVG